MQTPTHPLTTYWLVHDRPHAVAAAIASLVPDVPYLVALLAGLPAVADAAGAGDWPRAAGAAMWSAWGNPAALFVAQKLLHNLVLCSLFAIAALAGGKGWLRAVALGWMLHVWTDLALHADDAYPVLWPLTERVFPAPLSPWDPDHHGPVVGGVLALSAMTLWVWLARRTPVDTRGRIAAVLCMGMAAATFAGAAYRTATPEARRTDAWVDDGVQWTDETAPIAAAIADGRPRDALELIRTTALPPEDPSLPPWTRHRARARRQLLQGYAQDLLGNREQALASYGIARSLERRGGVAYKARRYSAEPFTNTPDPAVGGTWLVLFLWGMGASALLLWRVRAQGPAAASGDGVTGGGSGSSSAFPPR